MTCSHNMCYCVLMETLNASYFKTHFGEVLDRSSRRPLRITRRGREAAVLLSEAEYVSLRQKATATSASEKSALKRLQDLASENPVSVDPLLSDPRTAAILAKHSPEIGRT